MSNEIVINRHGRDWYSIDYRIDPGKRFKHITAKSRAESKKCVDHVFQDNDRLHQFFADPACPICRAYKDKR